MAAKLRVNITFDQETLRLADREARRKKTSRSEFIRSAVRTVATANDNGAQEESERARRRRAIEGIRRLARKLGNWPAEKFVHDWRYRLKEVKK